MSFAELSLIVLVKQVPDVANIPEEAWDREKGTLKRAILDNVLNPLDLHALTFAAILRKKYPRGRTVLLTMGPPQADSMLRDCRERLAADAVLLTDRCFAGADTVATAYSLSRAIERIRREMLDNDNYIVLAGMQSVDGDTAQVPPQVAEDLGLDQIAYVSGFTEDAELNVRRIGPAGLEVIGVRRLPVLLTVTGSAEPLYRSFALARRARHEELLVWDAASVGAAPERCGLPGSRTRVYRIFSPEEEHSRPSLIVKDPATLVKKVSELYQGASAQRAMAADVPYRLDGRPGSYHGEVWIYAETGEGGIREVSFELLGKARELAGILNARVGAVLICDHAGDLPQELIYRGADRVYVVEHETFKDFRPLPYKAAIVELCAECKPQIFLFGATPLGRELAPRIAYASNSGLTADCTRLEISDFKLGKLELTAILQQTRPALGGNIMATIMTKDAMTQMATVRPGVLKCADPDHSRRGEISSRPFQPRIDSPATVLLHKEAAVSHASLEDADIIVSGGRGFRSRRDFELYLHPLSDALAKLLGGTAKVGASRMAVEDGYTTHDRQVGQTGRTVKPRLYVACGISGAVQHISGMQNAQIIIAINKDPKARIFRYADVGLIGDLETVLPELARLAREQAS